MGSKIKYIRDRISSNIEILTIFMFGLYMMNNMFLDGQMLCFIKLTDNMRVLSTCIDCLTLLIGVICICSMRYTRRETYMIAAGYLVSAFIFLWLGEMVLFFTWTCLILTKGVSYDKWIKCSLYCNCIGIMAGILATVTGIHKDYVNPYYRNGLLGVRYTFGFMWPNSTGLILFLIMASYCWLKKDKMKWGDFLFFFSLIIVCYVFPNSQGATIVMLIFTALIFLFQYILWDEQMKKRGLKVLFYGAIACGVCSIILGTIDVSRFPVLSHIDAAMSYRFTDVYRTYEKYGFSLLGQNVNWEELNNYAQVQGEERNYFMDCSWMYLPVHYGIIFSLIFVFVYFFAMYKFVKKENVKTAIIFFCGALYAMEMQLWPAMKIWVFVIFLAEGLFQTKWNNE